MRILLLAIVVLGLIASWIPTILLGCLWLNWLLFFMSIEDYGDNDFATIFYVAVGFVLTCVTIGAGLLTAILNVFLVRRLISAENRRAES